MDNSKNSVDNENVMPIGSFDLKPDCKSDCKDMAESFFAYKDWERWLPYDVNYNSGIMYIVCIECGRMRQCNDGDNGDGEK